MLRSMSLSSWVSVLLLLSIGICNQGGWIVVAQSTDSDSEATFTPVLFTTQGDNDTDAGEFTHTSGDPSSLTQQRLYKCDTISDQLIYNHAYFRQTRIVCGNIIQRNFLKHVNTNSWHSCSPNPTFRVYIGSWTSGSLAVLHAVM